MVLIGGLMGRAVVGSDSMRERGVCQKKKNVDSVHLMGVLSLAVLA